MVTPLQPAAPQHGRAGAVPAINMGESHAYVAGDRCAAAAVGRRQLQEDQPPARPPSAPAAKPAPGPPATPVPVAAAPSAPAAPAAPIAIPARLYPMNEIATENGMVSGTVTNMMNGKGRLQLAYRGEQMIGEATRVANDQSKGVASAWGPNGSFMSCEYQMSSPLRGTGTCSFSDGAKYQVHVGN